MYGLIVKLNITPGKREEMIALLKQSTRNMPGCFSYVVANDSSEENALWVTEVWDSLASHDASLLLPEVKNVLGRARVIVADFKKVAVTTPLFGVGLQ